MHPDIRPEWPVIAAHYQRIGLQHASRVIWDLSYDHLASHSQHEASVFFFDDTIGASRPDGNWMGVVDFINNKNNFVDRAEELGMTIPLTLRFSNPSEVHELSSLPYPCYVKASVSVLPVSS